MRNARAKEAPEAPDVSKAMAAVYFSYEADPAADDAAQLGEHDEQAIAAQLEAARQMQQYTGDEVELS